MSIETPTPAEMESMIASAKASSDAAMTAPAKMPSEPPTVDDLMRFVESYSAYTKNAERHGNKYGDIDGANNCWLKIYAIGKELRAHDEGLQAECERLRSDPMAEGWRQAEYARKDRQAALNNWKAERERAESAERKLAEAVAALRKFSEHCPHCKAVVDEATK